MPYDSLRHFTEFLEKKGELVRVKERVSPILEITEIADRVMKKRGPALLFENVEGSRFPLLINTFGSRQRMSWALGAEDLEDVAKRIEALIKLQPPEGGLLEKLKFLPILAELGNYPPKVVKSGASQEVVQSEPNLLALPIQKCWPLDAGRYITMMQTFSKDPDTGMRNVGMYRFQVFDEKSGAMHWQIHKGGARHWRRAKELGQRIEAAVVLGGDPAMMYAASAPLPDPFDETIFAGFLRRKPVELVKCKTIDMEVPADADFVIEGYIDPSAPLVKEGPFGDHRGFYSLEDDYPKFHVTAITHRRDAIFPSTIVGVPPMEDEWMGYASVRLFMPAIRMMLPEIVDMHLPCEAVFHNLAVVSIKKHYPGHAKKVMHALWGLGQMMFEKIIVVVDEDVNVEDWTEVAWRATNSFDPLRDLVVVEGPVDALDHASVRANLGGKMGLDCTTKLPSEGHDRPWPPLIKMDADVKKKVDEMWGRLGIKLG
jgi:4-hydroxy-3-polyprenylbenzoate decarboxylase